MTETDNDLPPWLGDRTTTMFFKLPLSLKEHLDMCARTRNETTSHLVRLGITRILGLPDEAALMAPKPPQPTNERRNKARRIQRQLASLAPEILVELNRREATNEV